MVVPWLPGLALFLCFKDFSVAPIQGTREVFCGRTAAFMSGRLGDCTGPFSWQSIKQALAMNYSREGLEDGENT
jgi:hypothetical protein